MTSLIDTVIEYLVQYGWKVHPYGMRREDRIIPMSAIVKCSDDNAEESAKYLSRIYTYLTHREYSNAYIVRYVAISHNIDVTFRQQGSCNEYTFLMKYTDNTVSELRNTMNYDELLKRPHTIRVVTRGQFILFVEDCDTGNVIVSTDYEDYASTGWD